MSQVEYVIKLSARHTKLLKDYDFQGYVHQNLKTEE